MKAMLNRTKYRLFKEDYDKECKEMAHYFLGKVLVRKMTDGSILKGKIVETECYLGNDDKASCTYAGRRTPGNAPMYMPAGTCYVYQTYGMYHCFNISSREPGAAVLLRGLEPLEGLDTMETFRRGKNKKLKGNQEDLCNGPSKLCIAMDIKKDTCNKLDLADKENDFLWIEDDPSIDSTSINVVKTARIGIASAGKEWASKPLRFYILGSAGVSKRDKKAEAEVEAEIASSDS